MLECDNCQIRRAVYGDGEEWIAPNEYCSKCEGMNDVKNERNGKVITTIATCKTCGHIEKGIINLGEKIHKEKSDSDYPRDRKKYCLSDKEGQEYINGKSHLESFSNLMKDIKEREDNKEVYNKVAKIKKLKVAELKNLLTKRLAKQDYISLQFTKPEMERYVTISFTAEDAKSDGEEYDSKNKLKRLINKILKDTNWRLMSDGIRWKIKGL